MIGGSRLHCREQVPTIAREKFEFHALAFCLGVIGNGSYFWLIRGTMPMVPPATFEKRVNEVIETEDKRVVWYSGRIGMNILIVRVCVCVRPGAVEWS